MKALHRFGLKLSSLQTIKAPRGARFVSGLVVNFDVDIFALVDPQAPDVERRIYMEESGLLLRETLENGAEFLCSLRVHDFLIVHVFVEPEDRAS